MRESLLVATSRREAALRLGPLYPQKQTQSPKKYHLESASTPPEKRVLKRPMAAAISVATIDAGGWGTQILNSYLFS